MIDSALAVNTRLEGVGSQESGRLFGAASQTKTSLHLFLNGTVALTTDHTFLQYVPKVLVSVPAKLLHC
jgi:hypothetical protein